MKKSTKFKQKPLKAFVRVPHDYAYNVYDIYATRQDAEDNCREGDKVVELVPAADLRALKRVVKAARAFVRDDVECTEEGCKSSVCAKTNRLLRALAALKGER